MTVPHTGTAPDTRGCFQIRVVDGRGEIQTWPKGQTDGGNADFHWVHLLRGEASTATYLRETGLDHLVLEALLAVETRPRWLVYDKGLLVVLRGVNLNPGADPEDMVALRLWLEPGRVITLQGRPILAVDDLVAALKAGQGPHDPGEFLERITNAILERMSPVLDELDEEGNGLEEEVLSRPKAGLRRRVGEHRRQCIELRRHLAPMREVVTALSLDAQTLLSGNVRSHLHESSDRLIRIVEDLDALRDRAVVTHDELAASLSDQINGTMFRLSLVTAVFLPLTLVTSLLGINVGGIPGATLPNAFERVCLLLVLLGGVLSWLTWWRYLRRR
jgi:zinc transporter